MAHSELWTIAGNEPCHWRIPYVVRYQDAGEAEVEMSPAIQLLKRHERHAFDLIEHYGRPISGGWAIEPVYLEKIGTQIQNGEKLDQDGVEALFYWGRDRVEKEKLKAKKIGGKGIEELVDFAFAHGIGECREQVHYWFSQLVRVMIERLVNHELPVDLGFVRLHNSPYRVNWKSVIMSKFPTLGRVLTRAGTTSEQFEIADRAMFTDELLSLSLLMTSRHGGHCLRSVEVEMRQEWWKIIGRAERDRKAKLGEFDYAKYFTHSMRAQLPTSVSLYVAYCAQVALDSAAHAEGEQLGAFKLVPHRPVSTLHTKHRGIWPLPAIVDNKIPAFKPADDAQYLQAAYESLQPLRDIQSVSEDVRDVESGERYKRFIYGE